MTDFIKKAFVLLVLFLLVLIVYLVKNPEVKEGILARINIFGPGNVEISEEIKIGEKDINVDSLIEDMEAVYESSDIENIETESSGEEIELPNIEAEFFSPETAKQVNLENIERQIAEISEQIEKIEKEVKILLAMKEIQKEINDLAEKAEGLSVVSSM